MSRLNRYQQSINLVIDGEPGNEEAAAEILARVMDEVEAQYKHLRLAISVNDFVPDEMPHDYCLPKEVT